MGIRAYITKLTADKGAGVLTIEKKGTDELVQVAHTQTETKVLLNYPFPKPAADVLAGAGVSVPAGWKLDDFEQGTFAQYDATGSPPQDLADFIKAFFAKVVKSEPDSFYIEPM